MAGPSDYRALISSHHWPPEILLKRGEVFASIYRACKRLRHNKYLCLRALNAIIARRVHAADIISPPSLLAITVYRRRGQTKYSEQMQ